MTTEKAAHNMTPSTTKLAVNFLEYLTAPNVIGKWLGPEGNGFSAVNGSPPLPGGGVVESLLPKKLPPVTVEGVLDDVLTSAASNSGLRLLQEYAGGSLSFSAFSTQWQTILTQAATQWAATNKVHIRGL